MNFNKVNDIHSYEINGLPVKTSDLVCTTDGGKATLSGHFWWVIGKLIPGAVDHIVVYTGPDGRCVEAGANGCVITFDVPQKVWGGDAMHDVRGFIDTFYGIAYPLDNFDKSEAKEKEIRIDVANYCISQAEQKKPYNINFLNSETEDAFYCSQLAYKAYQQHGINLNTNKSIPNIPFTDSIVYPQEVWEECKIKERAAK